MPGVYIPPHAQQQASQGSGGQTFQHFAGMFWPQGDPAGLRRAAQSWRDVAQAIDGVSHASSGIAAGVRGQNQGAAIDAFGTYWAKWEGRGGGGYFEATAQASRQMADGLERYASAIDAARKRVAEIAAAAATVLGIGLVLTFVTFGISDAAAGATAAGLTAAAAAVGVDLSATVAGIVATVLTGAAIGAVASMTIDTAIQIERIYGFQDQKGFNWGEFERSGELGALTGGAGSTIAIGARALAPILEDGLPAFSKMSDVWGSLPGWAQTGIRGTLVGGGLSAGADQLTTGKVNPLDVALGAASGVMGDAVGSRFGGSRGGTTSGSIDESLRPFSPQERSIATLLQSEGHTVQSVPESAVRTPDARVDGVPTEFKSLSPGATDATVKNQLNAAKGQARSVIIDARGSGLTAAQANQGIARFLGANPGRVDDVRIIGDGFDIRYP